MDVYSVTNPNHISWLAYQLQVHGYLVNSGFEFDKWVYAWYKQDSTDDESILVWYNVNLISLEIKIKGLLKDGDEITKILVLGENTTLDNLKDVLNEVYQEM